VKYASKATPRSAKGQAPTGRPIGGGGIGAGFGGPSDRQGPIGPTMQKGAKTAVDTTPRLLNARQLEPRDNSGGFVLPPFMRGTLCFGPQPRAVLARPATMSRMRRPGATTPRVISSSRSLRGRGIRRSRVLVQARRLALTHRWT
jgi:hypothetical protein